MSRPARPLPAGDTAGTHAGTTQFSYDGFGNLRTITDAKNTVTSVVYDAVNRPRHLTVPRGGTSSSAPAVCRNPQQYDPAYPSGVPACTSSVTYDGVDNTRFTDDANRDESTMHYDAVHRVTSTLAPRLDSTYTTLRTDSIYDDDGHVLVICPPRQFDSTANGGGASSSCAKDATYSITIAYGAAGKPTSSERFRDATTALSTTVRYDADGNPVTVTEPSSDGIAHTTATTYDLLDRAIQSSSPRDANSSHNVQRYQLYTPSGDLRLSSADGLNSDNPSGSAQRITGSSYDADHRMIDTVSGLQVASSHPQSDPTAVDAALGSALPGASGDTNVRSRTVYDANDNVVGQYSPRAFAAEGRSGSAAPTLTSPDPRFLQATSYDANDRPVTQWTPRFADTGAGAAANTDDPNIAADTTQSDQCPLAGSTVLPPGISYATDTHLCVTRLKYDETSNAISQSLPTNPSGTGSRVLVSGYTADHLLAAVTGPDPSSTSGATTTLSSFSYDADGQRLSATDANGITACTHYNADNSVLARVTASTTTSPVCDRSKLGNVTGAEAHQHVYGYDANGQQVSDAAVNVTVDATVMNLTTTRSCYGRWAARQRNKPGVEHHQRGRERHAVRL